MDKLLFGISGLPLGKEGDKFNYSTGIEYLYEYFNDGASTKDDCYERVISLLDDAQIETTDNYEDMLKSLTGR